MIKYDIIIPHFGVGPLTELCRRCLDTVRLYSDQHRVILVDNDSPELDKVLPLLEAQPHRLIRMTENAGFVRAVNAGLALSTAPYVVILNNDTEAVEGWLPALERPLTGTVGISGPLTTTRGSWQGCFTPRRPVDIDIVLERKTMLAFFCAMFRRDVIERVGYLDERFGVGFADDDDYCWRAHEAGFDLALVQRIRIPHHHRSTFRMLYGDKEIASMQERALLVFKNKCLHRG